MAQGVQNIGIGRGLDSAESRVLFAVSPYTLARATLLSRPLSPCRPTAPLRSETQVDRGDTNGGVLRELVG